MRKYLIVYEKAGRNFSAYCPDLPGCVATGSTRRAAERNMKKAMAEHLRLLKEGNGTVPPRSTVGKYPAV